MDTIYIVLLLVFSIIWGVVWGSVTKSVIANKGYSENWFWWGFFFGFIALIVALSKPDIRQNYNNGYNYNYNYNNGYNPNASSALGRLASADGWKCTNCGANNPGYQTSCACGVSKNEVNNIKREITAAKQEAERAEMQKKAESQNLDMLKKYKDLFDSGAITQEEFDEKKKQLLDL